MRTPISAMDRVADACSRGKGKCRRCGKEMEESRPPGRCASCDWTYLIGPDKRHRAAETGDIAEARRMMGEAFGQRPEDFKLDIGETAYVWLSQWKRVWIVTACVVGWHFMVLVHFLNRTVWYWDEYFSTAALTGGVLFAALLVLGTVIAAFSKLSGGFERLRYRGEEPWQRTIGRMGEKALGFLALVAVVVVVGFCTLGGFFLH